MKKSQLRQIIKEELILFTEKYDKEKTAVIHVGENTWYVTKVDRTHIDMVNNEKAVGKNWGVLHIGQVRHQSYYKDIDAWLGGGKSPDKKVYKEGIIKEDWWTDLSTDEQEDYIEKHPRSKKAKEQKQGDLSSNKDIAKEQLKSKISRARKAYDTFEGEKKEKAKQALNNYKKELNKLKNK